MKKLSFLCIAIFVPLFSMEKLTQEEKATLIGKINSLEFHYTMGYCALISPDYSGTKYFAQDQINTIKKILKSHDIYWEDFDLQSIRTLKKELELQK